MFFENIFNAVYDVLHDWATTDLEEFMAFYRIITRVRSIVDGLFSFFPPQIYAILIVGVIIVIALRIVGRSD